MSPRLRNLLLTLLLCFRLTTQKSCVVTAFSIHPSSSFRDCGLLFASRGSSLQHEDDLARMQKETSQKQAAASTYADAATEKSQFLVHQQQVFDDMSDFFGSSDATPPEVVPILEYLANRIIRQTVSSQPDKAIYNVLDVGCGTGALFPFLVRAANEVGVRLHLLGLDLSQKMVDIAKRRAISVLEEYGNQHEITVVNAEFVECVLGKENPADRASAVQPNRDTLAYRGAFDGVITNACFGNFYDTDSLMSALAECLHVNGVMFITHPLGANFVLKLHTEDASTVPHLLPTRNEFERLTSSQSLRALDFAEKMKLLDENERTKVVDIYFASAEKVDC